jgi:hypothetical protein
MNSAVDPQGEFGEYFQNDSDKDEDVELVLAQGRFIVQPNEMKNHIFHEVYVDH